jgi:hypothetical protein
MEHEMETDFEARKVRAVEEAAARIKRGDHWLDWVAVGEGLTVGRLEAMRRAGTNVPVGAAYNKAFGLWLDEHIWARELDKATRNQALWVVDHRDEIERWRETLAQISAGADQSPDDHEAGLRGCAPRSQ